MFRWTFSPRYLGKGPYIADYPEQALLACIVQNWCAKCALFFSLHLINLVLILLCTDVKDTGLTLMVIFLLEAQNAEGFGMSVPDYRLQYKTHETPKSLRMMARVLMLLGSFLTTFLVAQPFIWTYCTSSCLFLLAVYLYILSMYVSNVYILSFPPVFAACRLS